MKFETLLGYWKMRGMIKHKSCQFNDMLGDSDVSHLVYSMTVKANSEHANIIYRYEILNGVKSKFALIYADILFNGFPHWDSAGSSIFLKNAKVSDLAEHVINRVL